MVVSVTVGSNLNISCNGGVCTIILVEMYWWLWWRW